MSSESSSGNVADLDAARTIAELRAQLRDKTAEVERLRDELGRHALLDDMTGLANRKGFYVLAEQALKHAARRSRPCLVVKLDIDSLAVVNERHGHGLGDLLIGEAAQLLRDTFRESDILARTDGNEFCVLVQDPGDDATVIRTRIQEKLHALNARAGRPQLLKLHLAIACTDPDAPGTLDELLARIDQSLYEQKHARRSRSAA